MGGATKYCIHMLLIGTECAHVNCIRAQSKDQKRFFSTCSARRAGHFSNVTTEDQSNLTWHPPGASSVIFTRLFLLYSM